MKLVIYQKNRRVNQDGFTLIEILLVVFIIAVLAAIALPRLGASSETARENADIATGHQLKSALDRYQIENGRYPKIDEAKINDGKLEMEDFIPQYISKLDVSTTQQNTDADNRGFGIGTLEDGLIPEDNPTNLIMLYLTGDGSAAEVRVYNGELDKVLWSSLN